MTDLTSASAPLPCVQPLEPRRLMSVSYDSDGWTVITPPADARVIHVSSSAGDDGRDGRSAGSAVRTLAKGISLLRGGTADQLLLKRGDVWHESFGLWTRSGRSADEPMVVGTYAAGPRPVVASGGTFGFQAGADGAAEVRHLALTGFELYDDVTVTGEYATGIQLLGRVHDVLIEDCLIRGYGSNIVARDAYGGISGLTVRRSVIVDAHSPDGMHSQGMLADGVHGVKLLENVFDHNGWLAAPGAKPPTVFNHNAYITSRSTGLVARGNLFANAASHGLQARPGGTVEENVFLDNPVGLSFGLVNVSPVARGGVTGTVKDNVFIGMRDIDGAERGIGLQIANTKPGGRTLVSGNVFTQAPNTHFPALHLGVGTGVTNPADEVGINDLTIEDNIVHKWGRGMTLDARLAPGGAGPTALNGLTVRNNSFQHIVGRNIIEHDAAFDHAAEEWNDNRYYGDQASRYWFTLQGGALVWRQWTPAYEPNAIFVLDTYDDADRTPATYSASLGGVPTTAAFLAAAREQSREDWRPELMAEELADYIQRGFGMGGSTPPPNPPVPHPMFPDGVYTKDGVITLDVRYTDNSQLNLTTLGAADIRLVGPGDAVFTAKSATVASDAPGDATVSYTFDLGLPAELGRTGDPPDGRYAVELLADEVGDTDGIYALAEALGTINVERIRTAPPTVKRVKVTRKGGRHALAVTFRGEVTAVNVAALVLTKEAGVPIDTSLASVTYNPKTRTATWMFPDLPQGRLPAGRYRVTLRAADVPDRANQFLDGNKDGIGGDDFVWAKVFRATK